MRNHKTTSRAERRQQKNRRHNLQLANIYSRLKDKDFADTKERAWLPDVWSEFSKEIAKDTVLRELAEERQKEHDAKQIDEPVIMEQTLNTMTDDGTSTIPLSTSSQHAESLT